MPKLFTQHGDRGNLHLETKYTAGKWGWRVLHAKQGEIESGEASSLGDATIAAEGAAGRVVIHWYNVGPEVEEIAKVPFPLRASP
jgi:hypothetical protein